VRVLFDQGTPVPLRNHLPTHQVTTAFELNWGSLSNGELLSEAEAANFEVLVTTDQNLRYQQNLTKRRIAIVVARVTFVFEKPAWDLFAQVIDRALLRCFSVQDRGEDQPNDKSHLIRTQLCDDHSREWWPSP